jgi:MoaA/NifB/PqqE/SkfB family radical SAM enzyme
VGFFSLRNKLRLARSLITKDQPVYVQFYVTARCNLACEQCNVIYANSDVDEIGIDGVEKIAENLRRIGVSIVLLTGGEPFVRTDLPEIVRAFAQRDIHVRIQTNGLAKEKDLRACIEAGAHDISISLDSIADDTQDQINGGFPGSWEAAVKTLAMVNDIFPSDSFAALGCVLAPRNIEHVPDLVRFATKIGWYVSLVPAHTTPQHTPRSFSTYDEVVKFKPEQYGRVREILNEVRDLRNQGYLLYDSDPYLEDMYRLITNEPVRWRERGGGVCDSPNLYFAVLPNGDMAVCCDYRLDNRLSAADDAFPERFVANDLRREVKTIAAECSGCLYGSFPEMTITARYLGPLLHRAWFFNRPKPHLLKKLTADEMFQIADEIRAGNPALYAS